MSTNITAEQKAEIIEQLRNIDPSLSHIANKNVVPLPKAPKNGLLSGMIITAATAVIVLVWGLFFPNQLTPFLTDPSPAFVNTLLISILIMTAHKIESYYTEEYNHCPVYLTQGRSSWAQNTRQAIFLVFVSIFLALTMGIYFILKGQPWTMLIPMIWLGQGLHELHHLAKSFVQRSYYSGTVSSLVFVLHVNLAVFPAWWGSLTITNDYIFYSYYFIQPIILLAFFFEHKHFVKLYTAYQKAKK